MASFGDVPTDCRKEIFSFAQYHPCAKLIESLRFQRTQGEWPCLRITSRHPDFNLWVDYNDDGDMMLCHTEFRVYGDSDYIDNLVDEREYNRWYTLAYRLGDID
jgi:hypothetical protein